MRSNDTCPRAAYPRMISRGGHDIDPNMSCRYPSPALLSRNSDELDDRLYGRHPDHAPVHRTAAQRFPAEAGARQIHERSDRRKLDNSCHPHLRAAPTNGALPRAGNDRTHHDQVLVRQATIGVNHVDIHIAMACVRIDQFLVPRASAADRQRSAQMSAPAAWPAIARSTCRPRWSSWTTACPRRPATRWRPRRTTSPPHGSPSTATNTVSTAPASPSRRTPAAATWPTN